MKIRGAVKSLLCMGILVAGLASVPAYALTLSPTDPNPPLIWTGVVTGNCDSGCVFDQTGYTVTEYYKMNNDGSEEKALASSYQTVFSGDPNDFEISYTGGQAFNCPLCILVVKDGTKSPVYIFDLGSWNGTEKIIGKDFYLGGGPTSGGISHVSIFSNKDPRTPPVPEPSTMILLGSGLAGLAAWKRRKSS